MLLRLALTVVVLTGLLWWMKDHYGYGKGKEGFNDTVTTDEMIATAYVAMPSENQQQATTTEIVTPQQMEANYQAVVNQREAIVQIANTGLAAELDRVATIDPTVPIEEQISRAPAPAPLTLSPTGTGAGAPIVTGTQAVAAKYVTPAAKAKAVAAAAAVAEQKKADFKRLLDTIDASARDACFSQSCVPLQAEMEANCSEFKELCFYRNHYNIQRCLAAANTDCRSDRVEQCRTDCNTVIQKGNQRAILNQGDTLTTNQRLQSPSGSTLLILRDTGDLELYIQGNLKWSSQTNSLGGASTLDQNPYTLMLTPSGELVIRNAINIDVWSTSTGMNVMTGGILNAPYKFIVAEGSVALLNKNGAVLWRQ